MRVPVAVNYRPIRKAPRLRVAVSATQVVSLNRPVDVADVDAIIKLAVAVEASLGPIDVLANTQPHRSARLTSAGNVRRGLVFECAACLPVNWWRREWLPDVRVPS